MAFLYLVEFKDKAGKWKFARNKSTGDKVAIGVMQKVRVEQDFKNKQLPDIQDVRFHEIGYPDDDV